MRGGGGRRREKRGIEGAGEWEDRAEECGKAGGKTGEGKKQRCKEMRRKEV